MSVSIPPRKEKGLRPPQRPSPVVLVQFEDGVLYSDVWTNLEKQNAYQSSFYFFDF
jgi:hypothetical protein